MKIRDWDYNLKIRLFGEALMNITYWMFFPFLTIYFADAFGRESRATLKKEGVWSRWIFFQ